MGTHLSLTPKTPDKMRVLLALTLLVAGALAGGKEKRETEMWMKMKAMEGCFGEDLVKDHMIKMKRSAAKCIRVETPELELPMFENSYRFANAMSRTPRGQGSGKMNMMKTFMMMKMFSEMTAATEFRSAPRTRTFTTSAPSCTRSSSTRRSTWRRCTETCPACSESARSST